MFYSLVPWPQKPCKFKSGMTTQAFVACCVFFSFFLRNIKVLVMLTAHSAASAPLMCGVVSSFVRPFTSSEWADVWIYSLIHRFRLPFLAPIDPHNTEQKKKNLDPLPTCERFKNCKRKREGQAHTKLWNAFSPSRPPVADVCFLHNSACRWLGQDVNQKRRQGRASSTPASWVQGRLRQDKSCVRAMA